MTLDKDDLFRNVMPGFVFIVVILSFKIINRDFYDLNETSKLLLSITAAFPIGFIIQTIHRFILHVACCEQKTMQKDEYGLLEDNPELKNKITKNLEEAGGKDWEKLAQLVAFSLDIEENKCFKIRINFLNSYFHALGASSVAVLFAFLTVSFFYQRPTFLVTVWSLIALAFLYGRKEVREDYQLCRKLFIQLGNLVYRNQPKLE